MVFSPNNVSCRHFDKNEDEISFNDGTEAGSLSQPDSCTRGLCLHEADTTINSWHVIQNGPLDRTVTRIAPFRSTLMILSEDPNSLHVY